ncbi:MAG: shikimate kinase [Hyphomicrobiales bacterium]|nr:MAG: shikimate kinase [Hyphomicrobiales bacterium]
MSIEPPHLEIRRPWKPGQSLFLLGPGGVGKSTLGRSLAELLGWPLIDLDLVFCDEVGIIGLYIAAHGYDRYRAENLALAERVAARTAAPFIFVTSSGFLAAAPGTADHNSARQLIATEYSLTLLPSLNIEASTEIVVARQLTRGFGLQRQTEEQKFRQRFEIYKSEGDALLIGPADAKFVADCMLC